MIIHEVGTGDYGLWMLVLAIISYFQMFDLGFSRALMHETAVHRSENRERELAENVSSFLVLFFLLALMVLAATALFTYLLPNLFDIAEGRETTARIVFLIVGTSFALQLPSTTAVGVLQGYERFDVLGGLMSTSRVMMGVTAIVVLILGGGLVGMALTVAAFDMLMSIGRIYFVRRELKGFGFSAKYVDLGHLRQSFGRSTAYFLGQTRGLVAFRLDAIIIGAFLTVTSVGVYSVALRLVQLARSVSVPLNEVLAPITSRLAYQRETIAELGGVMVNATRIGTGIMTGIAMLFVVFGTPFLLLWVGPEVDGAYTPLVILSIAMVIQLAHDMPSRVVVASDMHRYNSFLNIANIAINVGLSIILIQSHGLAGVAMGTLVSVAVVGGVTVVVACRLVSTSSVLFTWTAIVPALAPAIPAAALGYGLQELVEPTSWIVLGLEAGAAAAVFSAAFLIFNPGLREKLLGLLHASLRVLNSKRTLRHAVEGAE